ncbi:hypothetical protein RKD29_000327 [Streptomyces tendae]
MSSRSTGHTRQNCSSTASDHMCWNGDGGLFRAR